MTWQSKVTVSQNLCQRKEEGYLYQVREGSEMGEEEANLSCEACGEETAKLGKYGGGMRESSQIGCLWVSEESECWCREPRNKSE